LFCTVDPAALARGKFIGFAFECAETFHPEYLDK
jgi:hypothetical protein